MSRYIHKSHNVSLLLYHLVCPSKYRRVVFDATVDYTLRDICLEIAKRYEIEFIEIGSDLDHVHFLVQSVPTYSPTKIARTVKSITARRIRSLHPEVRKLLWKGPFWSSGYFIATVGRHGSEEVIQRYVKQQGQEAHYRRFHKQQLGLFDDVEG